MENLMITQTSGEIKYDFEGAKAALYGRLEEYRGAVFTEETKPIAKKEVAKLRKEKAAFSDRVKELRAEYMRPYNEFEEKAKELIALYDEPINLIDGQIKDFEEKRKKEKRELILSIYDEIVGDTSDIIPLEKIYNPKWENATYKEKDIRKDITEVAISARSAISTIKAMQSPDESEAIERYKRSLNITDAIMLINERAKVRADALKREEERKRREEEERIRREERERIEAERRHQEEILMMKEEAERKAEKAAEAAAAEVVEDLTPETEGESSLYEYRMSLTKDAKEKLEMYMDSVGIEWEMI